MKMTRLQFSAVVVLTVIGFAGGCKRTETAPADNAGGRSPADFPERGAAVLKPMDGGIELNANEIKGRNTWDLWCAGDEQFWERMSRESYGLIDLLKMIDSRNRATRFAKIGLINEPGFRPASKPDQYGLWIDEPVEGGGEPTGIDPKVYGHPTGVMGFRLFENPDFKGDAAKNWDGGRYYKDPDYAVSKTLVRPYKVGFACGACHIAFNPCKPPDDPENPKWENLASAIGNQYIREGATFASLVKPGGFFWEMLKTQPPGTSDLMIRKIRNGKTSLRQLAINTSAKARRSPRSSNPADFFGRCSRPSRPALPTLRASRRITSTIRTRSIRSSNSARGFPSRKKKRSRAIRSTFPEYPRK